MEDDPFHTRSVIEKAVAEARTLLDKWRAAATSPASVEGEEKCMMLRVRLQQQLRNIDWELRDLDETVAVAEKVGTETAAQLASHRQFMRTVADFIASTERELEAGAPPLPRAPDGSPPEPAEKRLVGTAQRWPGAEAPTRRRAAKGLWLGSPQMLERAGDVRPALDADGITHVVVCDTPAHTAFLPLMTHELPPGSAEQLTREHISDACNWIAAVVSGGGTCMVQGGSRAGAVCAAYIMQSQRVPAAVAMAAVAKLQLHACDSAPHALALRLWESELKVAPAAALSPDWRLTSSSSQGRISNDQIQLFTGGSTPRLPAAPSVTGAGSPSQRPALQYPPRRQMRCIQMCLQRLRLTRQEGRRMVYVGLGGSFICCVLGLVIFMVGFVINDSALIGAGGVVSVCFFIVGCLLWLGVKDTTGQPPQLPPRPAELDGAGGLQKLSPSPQQQQSPGDITAPDRGAAHSPDGAV